MQMRLCIHESMWNGLRLIIDVEQKCYGHLYSSKGIKALDQSDYSFTNTLQIKRGCRPSLLSIVKIGDICQADRKINMYFRNSIHG